MHYTRNTVLANERTVVALRFVESMGFPEDDDLVVDVLKDDLQLVIVTTSGKEYKVSMAELQDHLSESDNRYKSIDKHELRESVYSRWIYILGEGTRK